MPFATKSEIHKLPALVITAILLQAIVFLTALPARAMAGNWLMLGKNAEHIAYYDAASLRRIKNGRYATFWTKSYLTPECGQFSDVKVKLSVNKIAANEFDHLLSLIEMDCRGKRYRILANVLRSRDERALSVTEFPDAEWEDMSGRNILANVYAPIW